MNELNLVRAFYKTGVYVAELIEKQEEKQRALVKVVAVLKHPTQGDLHNPKMVDVPLFHQRKALAEFEKTWVPLSSLKAFEGELPNYRVSLQEAVEVQKKALKNENNDWARMSLDKLNECINEYGF
ncbi:sporulation phosphorelay system protein KapB [Halalkalibacter akibai]|uniref:Lipoprotein n=1 Tax=Halalkalibacter akibai (strain ATCC 43226 / DSM 21942 / CIP 109018 / JCM 9157 / 1139) TaxID=1236973 RepID=W4QTI2_HALA3|nr:sporulation phosphorelay system protein KapB [Halalkalibacter akibai]GAE34639.1 lipoprotein [Halalkalibacter akibai JCM 9157]